MEDSYLILRNNEEKGPFKLTGLKQFALQKDDLVWIEGKSTSWHYPFEIDALKAYVDNENTPSHQPTFSLFPHQSSNPENIILKTYVYVQIPNQQKAATAPNNEEKSEELTADTLQKKADEIYQRVMVFEKQKKEQKEETTTTDNVQWQQMKEKFKKSQQQNNSKKSTYKKRWIMGTGVSSIAAAGLIFTLNTTTFKSTPSDGLNSFGTAAVSTVPKKTIQSATTDVVIKQPVTTPDSSSKGSVDSFIDSIEKVLAKQHRLANSIPVTKKPTKNKNAKMQDSGSQSLITQNFTQDILPPEVKPTVPLTQLIHLTSTPVYKNNGNLQSLNVTLQNNSPQILSTVSVDVTYFKGNGIKTEQQTLLFQNVGAHSSATIPVQSKKKAVTASIQLVQINAATQ